MCGTLELPDLVRFKQGRSAYIKHRLCGPPGDEGAYPDKDGWQRQTAAMKRHHEFAGLEEPFTQQDELERRQWLRTLVPDTALTRLTARPARSDQRWDQFVKANRQPLEARKDSQCVTPMSSTGGSPQVF